MRSLYVSVLSALLFIMGCADSDAHRSADLAACATARDFTVDVEAWLDANTTLDRARQHLEARRGRFAHEALDEWEAVRAAAGIEREARVEAQDTFDALSEALNRAEDDVLRSEGSVLLTVGDAATDLDRVRAACDRLGDSVPDLRDRNAPWPAFE